MCSVDIIQDTFRSNLYNCQQNDWKRRYHSIFQRWITLWGIFLALSSSDAMECAFSRRHFLFRSLHLTTITGLPPSFFLATDSAISYETFDINNSNNTPPFVYSDKWTGTNLPRISLADATMSIPDRNLWPMGRWPDPILRNAAEPVSLEWFGTRELQHACLLLQNTARHYGAVGLAAQQCGMNARIVYLERPLQSLIMVNPQIVQRSPETEMRVWTENCLVLPPTFAATVLRDASITVEYQEAWTGAWKSVTLHGEMARAAQHELDHDRGILVTDHVELSELENYTMRRIETLGHEHRMELAYSRSLENTAFKRKKSVLFSNK